MCSSVGVILMIGPVTGVRINQMESIWGHTILSM